MTSSTSNFFDKVLGRIGRLDKEGLQTVVQELARERSFLETLFNTIEDGVLVADETGRILYFNQAVTRLLGLQHQVAEGQPITRFLPELEVSYPRARFLSLYVAPLDGQARGSSGLALIIHDATEARQKTFAAIESERIQALTLLAASVAHEIGNPLNALHIHLQLLERELRKFKATPAAGSDTGRSSPGNKRGPVILAESATQEAAARMEKYLAVAKGEITRLDYIVTQFLQAIRPAPPKFAITPLNSVVQATLELLRPELENRGLMVQERLASQLPALPLDPEQIKQALVNLIKNAMQAMTNGGVLTLQTDRGAEGVWVTVSDTGGGIPPEQINRIFEPFYTTKKKGTGLGLMIVQRIVRDHGGRIELESHLGLGTTFRLWLPLHGLQPRLLEAAPAETSSESPSRLNTDEP